MWWYNISIIFYGLLLKIAAPFNLRAKAFVNGRRGLLDQIKRDFTDQSKKVAWFHCASLGEFEQGRPVIELFRQEFPDYFIVLTFYSPSGYELRKNFIGADYVCYLPVDTPSNARIFLNAVKPSIAFFVKYEFWPNYLKILSDINIPVLSFSTIFRKEQVFFKWYGKGYRSLLGYFRRIFVQNFQSAELLNSIGITQYEIAGDTRFDRVHQISMNPKHLPGIEKFKKGQPCMVIGSSWPEDIEVILPLIQKNFKNIKFIIAPHEIDENSIELLIKKINQPYIRYTRLSDFETHANILIIDTIGLLSSIYQFADIAFIGGAYGKGLHNILEASIFRIPVFFGDKNYLKFQEALDLIEIGAASTIASTSELESKISEFLSDPEFKKQLKKNLNQYIDTNLGASEKIISYSKQIIL
jgi:3-deoxy-D-manno-octulosonic-acid transferase